MALRQWTQLFLLALALLACGESATTTGDTAGNAAEPAPPAAPAPTVQYQGIDVSHFQGNVDWAQVKTAGRVFAFAKATQGDSEVDPHFATNWAGIKSAGLVRGAYHFFDPDVDAAAQAEHFIATVRLEAGDLPPVIDIEVDEGVAVEGIDEDVRVWLEKVAAAYGVHPIVYSDLSFIEKYLATGFSAYPLWIADYSETAPQAPGDWDAWTFWQHSQSGQVAGVDGAVDLDVFEGTEETWKQLLMPAQ